jgi:purine-binding chemotaxis protein CheW
MKIVTFILGSEHFALPVEQVREITMDREITSVPNLPSFVSGIIHLREKVIPVVEGADRLNLETTSPPEVGDGRIVIGELDDQLIGLRVHGSDDVLTVDSDAVMESPELVREFGARFITGVIEYAPEDEPERPNDSDVGTDETSETPGNSETDDKHVSIMMLDLDQLFSRQEVSRMKEVGQQASQQ